MTDVAQDRPADVVIDHLALDVPGLDPAEAKALAASHRRAARQVRACGRARPHRRHARTRGGDQAELAARIAAALLERLI